LAKLAEIAVAANAKQRLIKVWMVFFEVLFELVALQLGLLTFVFEYFDVKIA
jgi:hypothetical protein